MPGVFAAAGVGWVLMGRGTCAWQACCAMMAMPQLPARHAACDAPRLPLPAWHAPLPAHCGLTTPMQPGGCILYAHGDMGMPPGIMMPQHVPPAFAPA